MYIATVTCNRDFQQMLLQAESIQKFVEPCTHVIIINEDKPDIEFWHRWLSPYYNKHKLNIIPRIKYNHSHPLLDTILVSTDPSHGWRTQQLQKLLLAYTFQDDYLLLDSKNFFTKKTNIHEWDDMLGSGYFFEINDNANFFATSANLYGEVLNTSIDFYFRPQTPFKIIREPLITKCEVSELANLLFYPESKGYEASEGILYSYLIKDEMIAFRNSQTPVNKNFSLIWIHNKPDISKILFDISLSDNIKITGIHRELLSKIDANELAIINFWIGMDNPNFGLGLKNKIYPMPRDSHV